MLDTWRTAFGVFYKKGCKNVANLILNELIKQSFNNNQEAVDYAIEIDSVFVLKLFLQTKDIGRAIIKACQLGSLKILEYLFPCQKYNILHLVNISISFNQIKTIRYLASKTELPNLCLIYAVQFHNLEIVKLLVELGLNPRMNKSEALIQVSSFGYNYIYYDYPREYIDVVYQKSLEIVKYLVEKGADINTRGSEPLISAAQFGNLPLVKYLIEQGTDVRARGSRAMREAALRNYFEIVRVLIEAGANPKAGNSQALRMAMTFKRPDMARFLIEQGADVRAKNDKLLKMAAFQNNLEMVGYLVKLGANVTGRDNNLICQASLSDNLEMVKFAVTHGADVLANHNQPLKNAVLNDNFDMIKYLVKHGADASDKDCLFEACRNQSLDIVEFLIDRGANVKTNNEALKIIICIGNRKMLDCLLSHGADLDGNLQYLLDYASLYNWFDLVGYAMKRDKKLMLSKALSNALERQNTDIVKYLVENGADVNLGNGYHLLQVIHKDGLELTKFLFDKGAVIPSRFLPHIKKALLSGNLDLIMYLKTRGLDFSDIDYNTLAQTIHHIAPEIIDFLVQCSADKTMLLKNLSHLEPHYKNITEYFSREDRKK